MWQIAAGPVVVHNGRDASEWRWTLRDGERTTDVVVGVSGTAMACADEVLPYPTVTARRTHGESALRPFLGWSQPPSEIRFTTEPSYAYVGGQRDTDADAAAIEQLTDWFRDRGLDVAYDQRDDGWEAILIGHGQRFASYPDFGEGATRLEALRAARDAHLARAATATTVEVGPATGVATAPPPKVHVRDGAHGLDSAQVERADLSVPTETLPELLDRLGLHGLVFAVRPDHDGWCWHLFDARTLHELDSGWHSTWDGAVTDAWRARLPISDEGSNGAAGNLTDPRCH
jgi:hypothetical protein